MDQSQHTITVLPAGTGQQTIISKRDIGKQPAIEDQQCSSQEADRRLKENQKIIVELDEMTYQPELPTPHELQEKKRVDRTTTTRRTIQVGNTHKTVTNIDYTVEENNLMEQKQERNNPSSNKKKNLPLRELKQSPKATKDSEKSEKQKTPTITTTVDLSDSHKDEMSKEEATMKPKQDYIDNELRPRRDTVQSEVGELRRGEWNRPKTDFFGQNIKITRLDGP